MAFLLLTGAGTYAQTGTWTELTNVAPDYNQGVMLLLTDGSVICFNSSGTGYGTGWNKLTPDASGSYVNGTWSIIDFMNDDRLYFSSQVLPSGKVYVAGGEYSSFTNPGGEVYDPVENVWTECGALPAGYNIDDGNSEILPNGNVLQGVVLDSNNVGPPFINLFYTPGTNQYTNAPGSIYDHDESAWVKLPDSSILFVGFGSTNSNRYIPKLNKWVNDATLPVQIYDQIGESGAAFMLPNGKAIFFGATQYNAIYTPSGDTTPGTWIAAANFPVIIGSETGQPDAPAAMMANGHILCAVSPLGTDGFNDEFRTPIYFVEYDYITNTFTQVTSNIPGIGTDSIAGSASYSANMLDLPDGNVLFSYADTYNSNNYWVYTPGSAALAAGKPNIDSIIPGTCPSYKLTGKLFNGITEGACYGDDWQMETNYPIIRLSNGSKVYYAKTTSWNRIGAVQTGNLEDTTVFTLPPTLPAGTYSLVVVANGNPSNPIKFTKDSISIAPITASVCLGSSIGLSASGTSKYTWTPSSGLSSTSGDSVDANPTVTTTYTVNGTDVYGCTFSNSVIVTVNDTLVKPVISKHNTVLTSSAEPQYQWEINDSIISGATNQNYTITKSGCYSVMALSPSGNCNKLSDTTCVTVTGIQQVSLNTNELLVYPNPTTNQLLITSSQLPFTEMQFYNVLGQNIIDKIYSDGTQKQIIDVSTLPTGMYFYRITLAGSQITGKFVKD